MLSRPSNLSNHPGVICISCGNAGHINCNRKGGTTEQDITSIFDDLSLNCNMEFEEEKIEILPYIIKQSEMSERNHIEE